MKTCAKCGTKISERRLQVLPHTPFCKGCSTERPVLAFRSFDHKCTSDVCFVRSENTEDVRQASRAYLRRR